MEPAVNISETGLFEKVRFSAATVGIALCFFGLGAYFIGVNKVLRQIQAKQSANRLVRDLRGVLQEPGGCEKFLGPDFQLNSLAAGVTLKNPDGSVNRELGQTLTGTGFNDEFFQSGKVLKNYDLRVHDIKLYKAKPIGRQVAASPSEGGDFQIIGYFAPIQSSIEKELYPLTIGKIAFPTSASGKSCYWRE